MTENAVKTGNKDFKLSDFSMLECTAESLFLDNSAVWPLSLTQFYLGHVPPLDAPIPRDAFSSGILRDRVLRNISSSWLTVSIRLAGRIWGDYMRRIATIKGLSAHRFRTSR